MVLDTFSSKALAQGAEFIAYVLLGNALRRWGVFQRADAEVNFRMALFITIPAMVLKVTASARVRKWRRAGRPLEYRRPLVRSREDAPRDPVAAGKNGR